MIKSKELLDLLENEPAEMPAQPDPSAPAPKAEDSGSPLDRAKGVVVLALADFLKPHNQDVKETPEGIEFEIKGAKVRVKVEVI